MQLQHAENVDAHPILIVVTAAAAATAAAATNA
jgi:hypothetical protein